ncbi:hypothetical protein N9H39_12115 [Gammaproteobacteria bacterium]|nr:hypothetical protein [Gammaproteobacteria bacterium]
MENSARVYNCAGCRYQVVICRRCDRGNIYCGARCSRSARRRKVAHQGSFDSPADALLSAESRVVAAHSGAAPLTAAQGLHCH